MKKWMVVLLIVVVVIVVLGIAKNQINQIFKSVVAVAVPQVMGTPVKIDSLVVGVLRPIVSIKGFKLYNPPGFPNEVFVDLKEATVEYDVGAIFKKKLHLPRIVLKLNEVVLYKNKDGKLNVDSLKIVQQKETVPQKTKTAEAKKPAAQLPMQIDVLELDLGKVIVKDYTKGEPPVVQGFDAGVHNKVYKDIKSAQQLGTLIMLEALGPAGLKSAGIYAAASVLGVAFLPAGVAGVLIGKAAGIEEYTASFEKVFQALQEVIKVRGEVVFADQQTGVVKGKIDKSDLVAELSSLDGGKVSVKVTARKYMIPKPDVAEGVLYQLSEKLK